MTTAKRLWKSFICCFIAAKPVKSLFSINFSCFCPTFQSIVHYAKRFRWSQEKVRSICTGGLWKFSLSDNFQHRCSQNALRSPDWWTCQGCQLIETVSTQLSSDQGWCCHCCGTKLNSCHCLCQLIDPWWTWHGEHCWLCWTNSNTRLTVFLIIII